MKKSCFGHAIRKTLEANDVVFVSPPPEPPNVNVSESYSLLAPHTSAVVLPSITGPSEITGSAQRTSQDGFTDVFKLEEENCELRAGCYARQQQILDSFQAPKALSASE